jgi:hypothetical protein
MRSWWLLRGFLTADFISAIWALSAAITDLGRRDAAPRDVAMELIEATNVGVVAAAALIFASHAVIFPITNPPHDDAHAALYAVEAAFCTG